MQATNPIVPSAWGNDKKRSTQLCISERKGSYFRHRGISHDHNCIRVGYPQVLDVLMLPQPFIVVLPDLLQKDSESKTVASCQQCFCKPLQATFSKQETTACMSKRIERLELCKLPYI